MLDGNLWLTVYMSLHTGRTWNSGGYSVEFINDYFSQRRCFTLSKKQLSNVKVCLHLFLSPTVSSYLSLSLAASLV